MWIFHRGNRGDALPKPLIVSNKIETFLQDAGVIVEEDLLRQPTHALQPLPWVLQMHTLRILGQRDLAATEFTVGIPRPAPVRMQ